MTTAFFGAFAVEAAVLGLSFSSMSILGSNSTEMLVGWGWLIIIFYDRQIVSMLY